MLPLPAFVLLQAAPAPSAPTAAQLVEQGTALHDAGRFDDALASCRQALRVQPGHADATYEMALTLSATGEVEEAVGLVREFLGHAEPAHPGFHAVLGSSLDLLGRYREAEDVFRKGLKRFPGDGGLLSNLGVKAGSPESVAWVADHPRLVAAADDFARAGTR